MVAYMTGNPAFVLVHPEKYPTNDPSVIHWGAYEAGDSFDGFDEWYAVQVAAQAERAARRVVVLDSYAVDDRDESYDWDGGYDLVTGVPDDGWEIMHADPGEFDEVRGLFPPGTKVTVGGFARNDCVAKVAAVRGRRRPRVRLFCCRWPSWE